MKVFRIPLFVLLLLLTFTLCNSAAVSHRCQDWTMQLQTIDRKANAQRWGEASKDLDTLYESWSECQTWFHTVIEHKEIDAAEALLQRCIVLCEEEDDVEFRATLADLCSQFSLLDEMERISIKNIL